MNQTPQQHKSSILDQFSRQAIPFSSVPGHWDAMQILIEMSGVRETDQVLDVACGPGIVACAFARHARHVTGIDITPAMIEQARKRGQDEMISNVDWQTGEAVPLPFDNDTFSLVVTRYSFHHFLAPDSALREMIRVCRPGGTVLVADVAIDPAKSAGYDEMEIMRDPSHVHALTTVEFDALFSDADLNDCRRSSYGVEIELEAQLAASFPNPDDKPVLRSMVVEDIGRDRLGINARREDGNVVYTVPISVYSGRKKPASA